MMFELWRAQFRRNKLERAYNRDIKRATKEKDWKRAEQLREEAAHYLSEANDEIQFFNSLNLLKRARGLPIPIPDYSDEQSWENNWGRRMLTSKGQADLLREIRKEETERLEHRMRFVKIVVIPVGTFILGVLGTYLTMKHNSDQHSQPQSSAQSTPTAAPSPKTNTGSPQQQHP